MKQASLLQKYYAAMADFFGPCHWWPAETPFEVMVGVVLTQNTAWINVEKALQNIKLGGVLNPLSLWRMPLVELEELIRPAGYYRVKAVRLKNMLQFLQEQSGGFEPPEDCNLDFLRPLDDAALRTALLGIKGIGPESADSIMLYALGRASFVVDAYTWRMLTRHGLVAEESAYDEMRDFFMDALPPDADHYNEYHALIVHVGKHFCRKSRPRCAECPLGVFL